VSIVVDLPPDLQRRLADHTARMGVEPAKYVEVLIQRDLDSSSRLDQVLAPVRRQFEESGMTEDDLDELVEEAREEIWRERQAGARP
jgi:hypothetical protein